MAWLDTYQSVEAALIKLFIVLGILCITPWAIWLAAEVILFFVRWAAYEMPIVGGKARGEPRPRAPTLIEQGIADKSPLNLVSLRGDDDSSIRATAQEEVRRPVNRQGAASGLE